MSKDLATLGLPDGTEPDEIRARWRKLCSVLHPDRGGNAVEFNEARKAYNRAMLEASKPKPCGDCNGAGKVTQTANWSSIHMLCQACGGSGYV